jgi:hypothetical protein
LPADITYGAPPLPSSGVRALTTAAANPLSGIVRVMDRGVLALAIFAAAACSNSDRADSGPPSQTAAVPTVSSPPARTSSSAPTPPPAFSRALRPGALSPEACAELTAKGFDAINKPQSCSVDRDCVLSSWPGCRTPISAKSTVVELSQLEKSFRDGLCPSAAQGCLPKSRYGCKHGLCVFRASKRPGPSNSSRGLQWKPSPL